MSAVARFGGVRMLAHPDLNVAVNSPRHDLVGPVLNRLGIEGYGLTDAFKKGRKDRGSTGAVREGKTLIHWWD